MKPDDSDLPPVPGWSVPPLPNQASAWRQPESVPTAPPAPAPQPLPQVPGFLPRPTAEPAGFAGAAAPDRRKRTRSAVLAGAVVAVLIVAIGTTATLALRTDSSRLSAEPSAAADGSVALGAETDDEPGRAAVGSTADTGEGATTSRSGEPSSSAGATPPGTVAPTAGAPAPPAPTTGTPAPAPAAPTTKAPTTKAPATKAPATKAPAPEPTTKAPAPKPPATKAPARKAPEIDKAVAKSGTRGAGPCTAKLAGGYGCLQTYGDVWWVYDTKADSHSAVVFWEVGVRSGQCANSMGNGKIGACNKNYPEKSSGRAKVCIMDWDTKQMHGCSGYISFKTS